MHIIDCQPKIIDQTSNKLSLPPRSSRKPGGRWSTEEHGAFLLGLSRYGREWKRIARDIPTRTSTQVRSHAQKVFAKYSSPRLFAKTKANPSIPESVRLRAEHILDDPAAAVAEVADTLRQLKDRHLELLSRAKQQQQQQKDQLSPYDDAGIAAAAVFCSFEVDSEDAT
jgi:SHAQKYF class myb-like DNA-binding protein